MLVKKNGTTSLLVERTSRVVLATWAGQLAAGQPACCRDHPATCSLNQITGREMHEDFLALCHRE
jgi:hypothetical protein